jgi:hypothetical protein
MKTMATLTVTTAGDVVDAGDGVLSLREAVAQSNATATVDTINFATFIEGQTLLLTGGELVVSRDVNIDGDANNDGRAVTIDGGRDTSYASRILNIVGGETDTVLQDLTITDGSADHGGAIRLGGENLDLTGCAIASSRSISGGGIYADSGSRIELVDSQILGNVCYDHDGGGIHGSNLELIIRRSLI